MNAFDGVREFLAVAETQGFTSAARSLGVSTSHVSRRVSALEERLGVKLVARTTRRVRLTDAGGEYHQRCAEMMQRLEETNQLVSGQMAEVEGHLRVSVAGMFAEQHIVPALAGFAREHPKLTVEINFDTHYVNFVDENIDFAIRYGAISDSGLIARKLTDHRRIAVASPTYFDRHGHPQKPHDLRLHNCLVCGDYQRWPFETPEGPEDVRATGNWRSNNESAIVEACRAGMGIAYLQNENFGNALRDGELTPTLEPFWSKEIPSWIVYPSRKYLPTRARRAVDHLLDHFHNRQEPRI
jgi:DNA-binding transcriptional LysR family regulator